MPVAENRGPEEKDTSVSLERLSFTICAAIFGGAFWQIIDPNLLFLAICGPVISRLALAGLMAGCAWYVFVYTNLSGADPESQHRAWYSQFRAALQDYRIAGFYTTCVKRAIAWIDGFLGDGDGKPKGLFPRAFGLLEAAPLWTANSYDRCITLALVYPVMTLLLFWTIWGRVGPVESAFILKNDLESWRRLFGIIFSILAVSSYFYLERRPHLYSSKPPISADFYAVIAVFLMFLLISLVFAGDGMLSATIALFFAVITCVNRRANGAEMISFIIFICSISATFISSVRLDRLYPKNHLSLEFISLIFISITSLILFYSSNRKNTPPKWENKIFLISILLYSIILFPFPYLFTRITTIFPNDGFIINIKNMTISFTYFLGLLTLVNAPFDWISIGVARALVRRGQEKGGVWPIFFALGDFVISIALLTLLAFAVFWSTEIYNIALSSGGADPIIDVDKYLAALKDPSQRGDPQYYWLYAMLFSSQIPAIVNFMLGAFCLLRGLPRVNAWIFENLPEEGTIPIWSRISIASLDALQFGLAVFIGLTAYYAFAYGLLWSVDPLFGRNLLDWLATLRITPFLPH